MSKTKLATNMENFALDIFNGMSQHAAYRKNYRVRSGTTVKSIYEAASKLAKHPKIVSRLNELREETAKLVKFSVSDVLREFVDIATADANELMQHRRLACRHCHGIKHHYQWKDGQEFALAIAKIMDYNAACRKKSQQKEIPDDDGGYGFAFNALPSPACPHCRGEGLSDVFFADTNNLTGKARKLFAGVKQTKNGIEFVTRDQDAALQSLAKALGMFGGDLKLGEPGDKSGATLTLPVDPIEAARMYAAFMKTA